MGTVVAGYNGAGTPVRNELIFSAVVNIAGGSLGDPIKNICDIGYDRIAGQAGGPSVTGIHYPLVIKSLNTAVNKAMSECRKSQSNGLDCYFQVYGLVVGFDANDVPTNELFDNGSLASVFTAPMHGEFTFVNRGDTPDRELVSRLNASNRKPQVINNIFPADLPEDDQ